MISRKKEFESILGNIRKSNNQPSRDILTNVKHSSYRRAIINLSNAINVLHQKLKTVSIENDSFILSCNESLHDVKQLSKLPFTVATNSQIEHRTIAETQMEKIIVDFQRQFKKRKNKLKKTNTALTRHRPIINTSEDFEKDKLSNTEEESFLAEALAIKRDFDEINIIETQVADIAHITQKINENIEEQAEIADDVHQNVQMTNENVRDGNDQILQATRSQSDFRVFSMIFLLGCSLTLLLLDAYK